jgi:hypothetical protein
MFWLFAVIALGIVSYGSLLIVTELAERRLRVKVWQKEGRRD